LKTTESTFTGTFNKEDGFFNMKGSEKTNLGEIYEGEWRFGLKTGEFKYTDVSGKRW
jgi:hypothetical protein